LLLLAPKLLQTNVQPVSETKTAQASPEKIVPALVHHYAPPDPDGSVAGTPYLIDLLRKLSSLSSDDHVDTVAIQLKKHEPGSIFNKADLAIINFVDDAVTAVLRQTDLDFKIEAVIRGIAPGLAALALEKDINAVTRSHELFDLIDLLIDEGIGWSEDLGILGEQFMEKVAVTTAAYGNGRLTTAQCISALKKTFKKEAPLYKKLEQRLCDRELKVLAGMKGHFFSTKVLNKAMTGQRLPLFIIFMLQGSWHEFLQQVFVEYGQKSKEWGNVQKITEAVVWSLQPDRDTGKRAQIMQTVPASIKSLCKKAPFDTDHIESALADLDAEYEAIAENNPSDPCDFELMNTDEAMAAAMQAVSLSAVEDIKKISIDQWFLYDDPREPDEKVARIKLILNWEETEQLLLTNHNRRKVVHMAYGEMINHLKSGVLKKLNPMNSAAETFSAHLSFVLRTVSDQNKKEKQIPVRQERKAVNEEYSNQRKEDLEQQLLELQQQAKRKKQRAMVLRDKAQKKLDAAQSTVESLNQNAWVKLPIMEGTLTPCKLVAIIPGNQTYIFANRAGLKVAEYTGSQLAHMIVTENSEILDTGAEFESALEAVVSGLREDKHKSYDELTGNSA
jgi:hypothetical protein